MTGTPNRSGAGPRPALTADEAHPSSGLSVPVAAVRTDAGCPAPDTFTTKGQPANPVRDPRGLAQRERNTMTRPIRACFTATIGGALAERLKVRRAA